MVKITDPEPIEVNGKVLYENELDRVKKMYGFLPPIPYGLDLTQEELAKRQLTKQKSKINKAR